MSMFDFLIIRIRGLILHRFAHQTKKTWEQRRTDGTAMYIWYWWCYCGVLAQ